jgi:hypothetical protein
VVAFCVYVTGGVCYGDAEFADDASVILVFVVGKLVDEKIEVGEE